MNELRVKSKSQSPALSSATSGTSSGVEQQDLQTSLAMLEIQSRRKANELERCIQALKSQNSELSAVLQSLNLLWEEYRGLQKTANSSLKPLFQQSKFRDSKYCGDPRLKPLCQLVEENVHLRECLEKITTSEVLWEHLDIEQQAGQIQEHIKAAMFIDYEKPLDQDFKIERLSSLATPAAQPGDARRSTDKCRLF